MMGEPIARAADGALEAEELDDILMELTRAADERVGLEAQAEQGTPV
jgi:hypothetical protein